ncbi:MAG: type II toxin-antitoxin system RelE/ParE family toxin [Spirochaetia bacterium]|nr:type II toxin-antitoxin system RelE/ParE family toxin [Spirochaetia bacterium]
MEYIAYEGDKFIIEWFFNITNKSEVLDYFEKLSENEQDKLFFLLKRMGDFGKISDKTKFRNEGDKIFAFKPKPHRFLCFFTIGNKIIITNAFHKKTDKLPKNDKKKAINNMNDYIKRAKEGIYYEKE